MSKWGENKLGKTAGPAGPVKKVSAPVSSKSTDRRDFLLNMGILLAGISFITSFLGMSIGSVRIAYKFYQYIYIYVILLAALKYGMSGGLCASLALGIFLIAGSHVLPQFKTMQAVPLSPNFQLLFFVGIAFVAAYFSEMNNSDSEALDSEIISLTKEIEKKEREIEKLREKLDASRAETAELVRRNRAGNLNRESGSSSPVEDEEPVTEDKPRVIKLRSLLEKKKE